MFQDASVWAKSCGLLIQVSLCDVSGDVNGKWGLFCRVLKTCVPLSQTNSSSMERGCTPRALRQGLGWWSAAPAPYFFLCSSLLHLTPTLCQVRVWDTVWTGFWSVRAHGQVGTARVSAVALASDFAAWVCFILPKLFPCTEICSHGKWSMLLYEWTILHDAERCMRANCVCRQPCLCCLLILRDFSMSIYL